MGKFGLRFHTCLSKVDFDTLTNSTLLHVIVIFTFFALDWKTPILENLVKISKLQICLLEMDFGV